MTFQMIVILLFCKDYVITAFILWVFRISAPLNAQINFQIFWSSQPTLLIQELQKNRKQDTLDQDRNSTWYSEGRKTKF